MVSVNEASEYLDGTAEAGLLKALLPYMVWIAAVVIAFRFMGMPGATGEFATLLRPVVNGLSLAAPAAAFLAWIASRGVEASFRPSRRWCVLQLLGGVFLCLTLALTGIRASAASAALELGTPEAATETAIAAATKALVAPTSPVTIQGATATVPVRVAGTLCNVHLRRDGKAANGWLVTKLECS